jgi:hypothetical protein
MNIFLKIYLLAFSLINLGIAWDEAWWIAVCRGSRFDQATRWSSPYTDNYVQPVNSPFDGDMREDLTKWGYTQSENSQFCDFDTFWGLGKAFSGLGMDARSNNRYGPNRCYQVGHGDPMKKYPNGASWPLSEQTYTAPGGRVNRVSMLIRAPIS